MLVLAAQVGMNDSTLYLTLGFLFLLAMLPVGIWLWMLVDCLSNEAPGSSQKLKWTVIIVIFGLFGAVAYSVGRRKQRIQELGK